MSGIDYTTLESIPADVLRQLPGGQAPPGYQPLSPHPESLREQTIAVGCVFLAIATAFFGVRTYVKLFINKKVTLDDFVCTIAFTLSIIQFSGIVLAVTQGAGGQHMWDSSVADLISRPNVIANWITTVFVTPSLGFAKLTFLIQYYTLFWPMRWVRISCWVGGGMSMAFYAAITITMFVLCSPWPGENFVSNLLSQHFWSSQKLSVPTGAVGAAVDIFLLVLPIRAVMVLQMQTQKKIALILVFMTGTLASVASLVGLYYRVKESQDSADAEWWVGGVWTWLQIELFSGIACSCMPSLGKLIFDQKNNKRSSKSPQGKTSYFRGASRSKLASERGTSQDTKESHPSIPITPYNSRTSATWSRPEMMESRGNRLSEIRGGVSTPNLAAESLAGHSGQHIHLLQEVSIHNERAKHDDHVSSHEDAERGGIDERW